jgi:hypothetical protein
MDFHDTVRLEFPLGFVAAAHILIDNNVSCLDELGIISTLAVLCTMNKHRIRASAVRPRHICSQNSPIPHLHRNVSLDNYLYLSGIRAGKETG